MTLVIKDLDPTTSLMVVEHICDGWLKAVVNMVHPTPVKRFTVQVQAQALQRPVLIASKRNRVAALFVIPDPSPRP